MRRILILFCAAVLLCSFSACAASPQPAAEDVQILDITQWPENDVSGGWLYSNGNAVVTVSQSGSRMIIGITFESID